MSELKFRSSILKSIYYCLISNIYWFLFIYPFVLFINSYGNLKYSVTFVSLILALILFLAILAFGIFLPYFYPITIKDKGIHGYDIWGNYSFVAWEEIDKIEPYKSFGFQYLRLFFQNSTVPLWISLSLQHQEKFNQTIIKLTNSDNPLHQALLSLDRLFELTPFHGKPKNKIKIQAKNKKNNQASFLKLDRQIKSENSKLAPWMKHTSFVLPPTVGEYGYCIKEKLNSCSRSSLIENIKTDKFKKINLVWTPEKSYLVSPEEIDFLFDAINTRDKIYAKKMFNNSLLNLLIWGGLVWQYSNDSIALKQIMLFNWLAIGVIPTLENTWELYQAKQIKTARDIDNKIKQSRYTAWLQNSQSVWTLGLTVCISLVAIVQLILFFIPDIMSSINSAGIIKPAVREGEIWRLFTGTLLHGNILHFIFNIFALFILGKLIEVTINKVYVPIVFVLSAFCGSLCSFIFIPDLPSVGASGGIMGLLGFLIIFSLKANNLLPPANTIVFVKAAIYTFFAGLLANDVIDNPAHIGGFLTGALLGYIVIPRKNKIAIPLKVSSMPKNIGLFFALIIVLETIFTILKLLLLI